MCRGQCCLQVPGAAGGSAPAGRQRGPLRAAAAHPGRLHERAGGGGCRRGAGRLLWAVSGTDGSVLTDLVLLVLEADCRSEPDPHRAVLQNSRPNQRVSPWVGAASWAAAAQCGPDADGVVLSSRTLFRAICSSIFSTIVEQAPFAIEDLMKELEAEADSEEEHGDTDPQEEVEQPRMNGASALLIPNQRGC